MKKPIINYRWHHPQSFFYGYPPTIWVEIWNTGSPGVLFTDGKMNELDMGKGKFPFVEDFHLEPGHHYGRGPIINKHIAPNNLIKYDVRLLAVNKMGYSYVEISHVIPIFNPN